MRPSWKIHEGDVLDRLRELEPESVQCVVTSPPYWGLRDYGVEGAGGLEPTLEEHLSWLVEVFREVRRVLRSDGCVWLNYGDAYNSNPSNQQRKEGQKGILGTRPKYAEGGMAGMGRDNTRTKRTGLAPKQRLLLPARVALALQADGWWVRSEIVWAKGVSFCDTYSGSCMPSSVRDRPTDSHEMLYLLTKRPRYFYDLEAVREGSTMRPQGRNTARADYPKGDTGRGSHRRPEGGSRPTSRNIRTVWAINPQPMPEAHFATFPEALVTPCIRAGTSEHGACSECGAPWVRVVSRRRAEVTQKCYTGAGQHGVDGRAFLPGRPGGFVGASARTTGWQPTCTCFGRFVKEACSDEPGSRTFDRFVPRDGLTLGTLPRRPCVILDPFAGSGTVGVVALREGRSFVGIELSPEYCAMARRRMQSATAGLPVEDDPAAPPRRQQSLFG